MKDIDRSYSDLLDPEVLRPRLTKVSLFIVAFEMLKDTIVDRPKRFFQPGPGDAVNPILEAIFARNRSPLYAGLDWLRESGAIDESDTKLFEQIKTCRSLSRGFQNPNRDGAFPLNLSFTKFIDDHPRLRQRRRSERVDEAPDARVPRDEPVIVDRVLPNGHGVAATADRFGNQLSVRRTRSHVAHGPGVGQEPSRWTPPPWWPVLGVHRG